MTGVPEEDPGPAEDEELLRGRRRACEAHGPPPAGLTDLAAFALDVEALAEPHLEPEVMRLVREDQDASPRQPAGARGDDGVLTVTFASASATVLLAVARTTPDPDHPAGLLRIDGWVVPGGVRVVDVRCGGPTRRTTTDATGRFVAADVPCGPVQVVLQPAATGEAAVVTPAIAL